MRDLLGVADGFALVGFVMMGVGLWLTVGFWALVISGALLFFVGMAMAMRGS